MLEEGQRIAEQRALNETTTQTHIADQGTNPASPGRMRATSTSQTAAEASALPDTERVSSSAQYERATRRIEDPVAQAPQETTTSPPSPATDDRPGPSNAQASTPLHWTFWLVDPIYQVSGTATPHDEPVPSSSAALPPPSPPLPDPFESPAPDSPPPRVLPNPTIASPFLTSPFTTRSPQHSQKRPFDISTLFSSINNPAARELHLKRPYLHITTSPPHTGPERGLGFDSDASEDESVRPRAPVRDPPFRPSGTRINAQDVERARRDGVAWRRWSDDVASRGGEGTSAAEG